MPDIKEVQIPEYRAFMMATVPLMIANAAVTSTEEAIRQASNIWGEINEHVLMVLAEAEKKERTNDAG